MNGAQPVSYDDRRDIRLGDHPVVAHIALAVAARPVAGDERTGGQALRCGHRSVPVEQQQRKLQKAKGEGDEQLEALGYDSSWAKRPRPGSAEEVPPTAALTAHTTPPVVKAAAAKAAEWESEEAAVVMIVM